MTIYQVLDEQNHPVFEAESFVLAQQEAELLNHSFDDHYFFVETVAAEQAYQQLIGEVAVTSSDFNAYPYRDIKRVIAFQLQPFFNAGGADGTRTRDPRRDRPVF